MLRVLNAVDIARVRAILVHAISENLSGFMKAVALWIPELIQ
jgi:hypothetical protein